MREGKKRGGDVAAEGIGLIGPIEAMGASGVLGEAVLGLGVVLEDLRELVIGLIERGFGSGERRGLRWGSGGSEGHGGGEEDCGGWE